MVYILLYFNEKANTDKRAILTYVGEYFIFGQPVFLTHVSMNLHAKKQTKDSVVRVQMDTMEQHVNKVWKVAEKILCWYYDIFMVVYVLLTPVVWVYHAMHIMYNT